MRIKNYQDILLKLKYDTGPNFVGKNRVFLTFLSVIFKCHKYCQKKVPNHDQEARHEWGSSLPRNVAPPGHDHYCLVAYFRDFFV